MLGDKGKRSKQHDSRRGFVGFHCLPRKELGWKGRGREQSVILHIIRGERVGKLSTLSASHRRGLVCRDIARRAGE